MTTDTDPHADTLPTSFLTFRLAQVHNQLNAQANAILKGNADVSLTEWRIILLLSELGNTTASQIVQLSRMDKGQVSKGVASLVRKSYVATRPDDQDQRKVFLDVTAEGQALLARILPLMKRRQERLTRAISPSDREYLYDILQKIDHAASVREF